MSDILDDVQESDSSSVEDKLDLVKETIKKASTKKRPVVREKREVAPATTKNNELESVIANSKESLQYRYVLGKSDNYKQVLRAAHKELKPKGTLVIIEPHAGNERSRFPDIKNTFPLDFWSRCLTAEIICKKLKFTPRQVIKYFPDCIDDVTITLIKE